MYVSVCTHISKIYGQVVLTKINAICFYSFFSVCGTKHKRYSAQGFLMSFHQ